MIFNSSQFEDHVWTNIKLQGSDSLLVGCVYHSPSDNIGSSTLSHCDLFTSLDNYTHLSGTTNNRHIESSLDAVDDLFLFQHITEPTTATRLI